MKLLNNICTYILGFLMALFGLTSCVSDSLEMPGDIDPDLSEEQYSLNFMINLQSMQSRAGSIGEDNFEDHEDYIDAGKIFMLFFTKEDKLIKMFSSDQLSLLPVKSTNDTYSKNWSVHIPISKIDNGEDFAQQLRDNDFKIAVLANWGTAPKINEGEDIDVLHHQTDDNDPYYKKRAIYQFLYDGRDSRGKMGNYTNWVNDLNSGVMPDTNQPIEMYGIQEFGALGNYWPKGTSFDLSNYNKVSPENYVYNIIPLLRSVAKIELKIPRNLQPRQENVYLCNLNGKARWEPLDISSNTNGIWKDFVANSVEHPADCEWHTIRGQIPFYVGSSTASLEVQASNYKEKLAWYYGSWAKEGYLGTDPPVTVPETNFGWEEKFTNKLSRNYPRIMNPLIESSDRVNFIETPDEGIYKRYILYVGEKFVDDPEDVVNESETSNPKVCHIEFALGSDISTNPDNLNFIRIYFIEGGHVNDFNVSDGWETYEKNTNYLVQHWPIMRNHVYSFTVKDTDNLAAIVSLKVLPWKMVEGNNSYDW